MRYENPVWHEYFADPFILKCGDTYYAYGTGATPTESDGRAFPMLRSNDLVNWQYLGGALPTIAGATAFWAPEVAEEAGKYYMYFSAATGASDESHRIRVAVADQPAGPFADSGTVLMPDLGFSIDAAPFRDPKTGQWYLFFAHDFLEDEPQQLYWRTDIVQMTRYYMLRRPAAAFASHPAAPGSRYNAMNQWNSWRIAAKCCLTVGALQPPTE